MDKELKQLLDKAKAVTLSQEELDESHIRMAVANGVISDGRVTMDALKAAQVVKTASAQPTKVPA
jgi:hypothetical protein